MRGGCDGTTGDDIIRPNLGIAESESTMWALRNPGKPVRPARHRASRPKTAAEKISSKMRSERSMQDKRNLHQAVTNVQNYCKQQAEEIAKEFEKKPEYIHRLIHSASIFKATRNPTLFNALVHQKAKEINADLPEGQHMHLSDIQTLVHDELLEREITEAEKESALKELQEHRETKTKGARASNLAAAQDLRSTLLHIDTELGNLHERTGSYGFTMVSRGHVHDKGIPGWAASADATLFIREVLKMDVWDLLKKFELWAVTREYHMLQLSSFCFVFFSGFFIDPTLETLLSMRTECATLITDGLRSITGSKKVIMNYANYDTAIMQKYNVRLNGWPATITFASPHHICTIDEIRLLRYHLLEKTCKWVKLTREEVKRHMDEYAAKVGTGAAGRRRKVRADKGKPRKRRRVAVEDEEDIDEDENEDNDAVGGMSSLGASRRSLRANKYKSQPVVNSKSDNKSDGSGDAYEDE
ncbi:hypothetical protein F5887DRAFT_912336 [Amanita rubescens]|nr:hypothetical protein F5887DRAFT_912336 [Amanita rubescens]